MLQLAGIILLTLLPLPAVAILLLLGPWLWLARRELTAQWRGYQRVAAIRIDSDGIVESIDASGQRCCVTLVAGSFVFPHFAWLRLQFPDRQRYAEFLAGESRSCESWHWLQLTWRQHRAHIGRMD